MAGPNYYYQVSGITSTMPSGWNPLPVWPWIPLHDCVPRTVYCPCCGKNIPVPSAPSYSYYPYLTCAVTDGNDTMQCNHGEVDASS